MGLAADDLHHDAGGILDRLDAAPWRGATRPRVQLSVDSSRRRIIELWCCIRCGMDDGDYRRPPDRNLWAANAGRIRKIVLAGVPRWFLRSLSPDGFDCLVWRLFVWPDRASRTGTWQHGGFLGDFFRNGWTARRVSLSRLYPVHVGRRTR